MDEKRGLFISFEGGEGAGKSTHIQFLEKYLREKGYKVLSLREPGGTPMGEEIRHTLKHSQANQNMCPESELLLLNASRAQLVNERIRPALSAGQIVLCDRFYDSTTAYQGYGRGLDMNCVKGVIDLAVGETRPDLTFLINITPKQSEENRALRLAGLPFKRDRFEDECDRPFFERVYQGFQEIARQEPERVKVIEYKQGNLEGMQRDILKSIYDLKHPLFS